MTIAPTKDFVSIGTLAGQMRVTVRTIERAADELGIQPAVRINFIPHFDGDQCEKIADTVQQQTETNSPRGKR